MASKEARKSPVGNYAWRLDPLEKWIFVDVVILSADVGDWWQIMPVAENLIGYRGKHLAGIHCLAPFGSFDLVDGFFVGQDSEIPGTAKPRQKIHFVGQCIQRVGRLDVGI